MNRRLRKLGGKIGFKRSDLRADTGKISRMTVGALSGNPAERKIFMRRRIYKTALITAALAALLTTAVFAANFGWNEKMIELFKPSESQMERLGSAADIPEATVTQNGVTVTVKQTLADNHGIYALCDIEAPQDFVFTDEMMSYAYSLDADFAYDDSRTIGMGSGSFRVVSQEGNKRTMLIRTENVGTLSAGSKMSLYIKDWGYVEHNEDYSQSEWKTLLPGEWELEWQFDGTPAEQKTVYVNQKVDINGVNDDTFTTLEISPMSVWITVEGDDVLTVLNPVIKFKDGGEIHMEVANDETSSFMFLNFQDGDNRQGKNVVGYNFDKITDISEIESVTVGDVTVTVE